MLLTDEALQPGLNSTITCTYDGTNYYIYMDGKVAAGPIPNGLRQGSGGQPFPQIPNFSIVSMSHIVFQGAVGCDPGCTNGWFSNIQLSTMAIVPSLTNNCYSSGLPSPTPITESTPTDITTATPIQTATPSPSATMTATPTPGCSTLNNGAIHLFQGKFPGGATSEPWANVNMDHTTLSAQTISHIGCFLTCFSMMDPDKNTPSQLNTLFTTPGYINSKGNLWDGLNAANAIGFDYDSEPATGSDALGLISQHIGNAHTYVVVGVSPSHYVLVTGEIYDAVQKKCRFTINDPAGSRNYSYLDQYTNGNYTIQNVEIFTEQ